MRKYLIALILIVVAGLFISCAQGKIEDTIAAFETAVNADSTDDIQDVLSPDSNFYITGEFATFLDYFDGFRNVHYSNLDISTSGEDADVYSDGTYNNGSTPTEILFVMKREGGFLSALFGEWDVLRYYDFNDFNNPVWQKLKDKAVPVE